MEHVVRGTKRGSYREGAEMTEGIDMRTAVQFAFQAIEDLYPGMKLKDLLLEEVLLRNREWEVTLGFTNPYNPETPSALGGVLAQPKPRIYKRLLIDANTGNLKGMLDGRIDAV